jgi:hypothetical protein
MMNDVGDLSNARTHARSIPSQMMQAIWLELTDIRRQAPLLTRFSLIGWLISDPRRRPNTYRTAAI